MVLRNESILSGGMTRHYAHTLHGRPPAEWQGLLDHLRGVAKRAEQYASAFGAGDWGKLAGLWHDLGKYSDGFQAYLAEASSDSHQGEVAHRVDHSTAGAQHAVAAFPVLGNLLGFVIAGHHSGLLDTLSDGACLHARLGKQCEPVRLTDSEILQQRAPNAPPFLQAAFGRKDDFTVQFFVRMLFSCLVDADFQDTEAFMNPGNSAARPAWPGDVLAKMEAALAVYLDGLGASGGEVNRSRAEVLEACRRATVRPPGLFTLTVPTGGGKTLSSLAFALGHARRHGLNRVIYVVPFTSIIEQNASVFRDVMRPLVRGSVADPVVEHHSNLDPKVETTENRLAAENWDAPIVVTTAVQFYESLFSNRTSRCRKLHNLSRAVVILDEAQCLPVDYLGPCLRALKELTENYETTVVLCTATQPAVARRDGFGIGLDLDASNEIIPDPPSLYSALRRVTVEDVGTLPDDDLVKRLMQCEQVLCIVNTRRHALRLWNRLDEEDGHFHLSGSMCPEHRSATLSKIRRRLDMGSVCRVVSTQLVEAGVDIDFPVVFRSLAGVDAIAQAAGRCNRNGNLASGKTVIFQSEHTSSEVFLRDTAQIAREVLPLHGDPLSLETVEHYFRLYYWDQSDRWDARNVLDEFRLQQDRELPFLFGFARTASRFRLIEDSGRPILIPWGEEGARLCEELRDAWVGPPLALRRKLQRYTVQVPLRTWQRNQGRAFEMVHDQYPVLIEPKLHYSKYTGLVLESDVTDALMV